MAKAGALLLPAHTKGGAPVTLPYLLTLLGAASATKYIMRIVLWLDAPKGDIPCKH